MAEVITSKEQVYEKLKEYLVTLFDIAEDDITMNAHLADDLDLDSIDAVDLMVKIQELTGEKIPSEEFKTVRTISDVVDRVYALVK